MKSSLQPLRRELQLRSDIITLIISIIMVVIITTLIITIVIISVIIIASIIIITVMILIIAVYPSGLCALLSSLPALSSEVVMITNDNAACEFQSLVYLYG